MSRAAARLSEVLDELRDQPTGHQLATVPRALWLRTLLVHGASWPEEAVSLLKRALGTIENRHTFTDDVSALLTFGKIQPDRVNECAAERATVLAGGEIGANEQCMHRVPIPPSLNAHTGWRRLTITMSWFSPINPTHRKYRRAALVFKPPGTQELVVQRHGVDWHAVQRGTLQHEVLQAGRGVLNVQADAFLDIPVVCTADAGSLDERVPYAMAVTLEVAPGVNTRIYDEVRARIVQRVGVRPAP